MRSWFLEMILAAALSSGGCSWIMDTKVQSPDSPGFECRKGPAVGDFVIMGSFLIPGAILIGVGFSSPVEGGGALIFPGFIFLIPTIVYAIAGGMGMSQYNKCNDDLEEFRANLASVPACPPGTERTEAYGPVDIDVYIPKGMESYCLPIPTGMESYCILRHGWGTTFHENGVVASRGLYRQGKKVGKWLYYDREGRILREKFMGPATADSLPNTVKPGCKSEMARYEMAELLSAETKTPGKPGPAALEPTQPPKLIEATLFCPPGNEKHGAWPPKGFEVYCTLPGGQINDGWILAWYSNGTLRSQGHYKNGQMDGRWFYFYPNGQNRLEAEYQDGKPVGTWIYYDRDGNKLREEKKTEEEPKASPPAPTAPVGGASPEPSPAPPVAPRVLRY